MIRKILLVLSVVLIALNSMEWIRSYWYIGANRYINFVSNGGRRYVEVSSSRGLIGVVLWQCPNPTFVSAGKNSVNLRSGIIKLTDGSGQLTHSGMTLSLSPQHFAGNTIHSIKWGKKTFIGNIFYVCFPFWVPLIIFTIYPMTYLFVRGPYRRYYRRKKGSCIKCGYNLTGNISGVCPECGEKTGAKG